MSDSIPPQRPPEENTGQVPVLKPEQGFGGAAPRLRDLDAEIENELAAALGGMSDKDLYGEPAPRQRSAPVKPAGGMKKARVIRVHGDDVFMDVPGGRSGGVISMMQFPEGRPEVGAEFEVSIEGYDDDNGLLILSRKGAAMAVDWSSVATGMIVEARVTGTNKGGLDVEVSGIRGFMPISQISLYRVENPEQFINQRLRCLVTDANPEERNLIVSARALLEQEREQNREKLWAELAEGQVREGTVRSVREFGAFVDLGGADGLLHVSEMSWSRVKDPASVVQPGQKVNVVVLKLDREARKIGLGMKQLAASPWDDIDRKYPPSTSVTGRVTRIMDFGAFVELEPGVEGLVHISELAPQRVWRVRDVLQEGQEVKVVVLRTDASSRKMSLSLKQALPKPDVKPVEEEPAEEEAPAKPARPRTTPLRGGIGDKSTGLGLG
jgi:small subunit ribosomal protein S1